MCLKRPVIKNNNIRDWKLLYNRKGETVVYEKSAVIKLSRKILCSEKRYLTDDWRSVQCVYENTIYELHYRFLWR